MPRDLFTSHRRVVPAVAASGLAALLAFAVATLPASASATVASERGSPTPTASQSPVPGNAPAASPAPDVAATDAATKLNPANPFTEPVGGAALAQVGRVVSAPNAATPPPKVEVEAYLLADLDTGKVLAAKNAHTQMRPASTLKTLTAVTLLPRLDKRARYTAVRADADMEGSKVGVEAGNIYTIDQLFYGLFLPSGNDAANALANASGGVPAAIRLMNDEAKRLGAFDTRAVNPSGLDAPGQVSSAYDLALFAREGLANPEFRRYATTQRYDFPGRKGKTYQIQNTNQFLREYPGAIGVKNGYTTLAHNTLVAAAQRDGHRLVVSLLHADAPSWEKAAALLDWGFAAADDTQPVGTLVTPDDVARAEATLVAARTPTTGPATAAPEPVQVPEPADKAGAAPGGAAPTIAPQATVVPGPLQRLPLWIWGAGALFVVLSSLRVYTYVRARRRPSET